MRFARVQSPERWWRKYTELAILFFLHAMAMAMWFVPLGSVLKSNGYENLVAACYATFGISAFISPLIFGALADQRYSPVTILRLLTIVTALQHFAGATLVACELETGRQHQIRIHLAEAGHPLLGETVYVREWHGPALPAPRLMLHASVLGFVHPRTGRAMRFEDQPPDDFETVRRNLERLRS